MWVRVQRSVKLKHITFIPKIVLCVHYYRECQAQCSTHLPSANFKLQSERLLVCGRSREPWGCALFT